MVVTFEFIGSEPIENVITCMNYQVDKVVFFGYEETIRHEHKRTGNFLKKYCGVSQVVFCPLPPDDMDQVLKTMEEAVKSELAKGNRIYFDVSGGESPVLVAFGILSTRYETPMHLYQIPENRRIDLGTVPGRSIQDEVPSRRVKFDLDSFIEMMGGRINHSLHKKIKSLGNPDFEADVAKIWEVARKYPEDWNPFSEFLRTVIVTEDSLVVRRREASILNAMNSGKTRINTMSRLDRIIRDLVSAGVLLDLERTGERYCFRFKNKNIFDCLCEGGSILELHTGQVQKEVSDDCRTGVHLDWDGVIHTEKGTDVLNEIDVLSVRGNVATFISCKSGKMGPQQTLYALYELETVASQFGGKYAKKMLVTVNPVSEVYRMRAEQMGIEIRVILDDPQ